MNENMDTSMDQPLQRPIAGQRFANLLCSVWRVEKFSLIKNNDVIHGSEIQVRPNRTLYMTLRRSDADESSAVIVSLLNKSIKSLEAKFELSVRNDTSEELHNCSASVNLESWGMLFFPKFFIKSSVPSTLPGDVLELRLKIHKYAFPRGSPRPPDNNQLGDDGSMVLGLRNTAHDTFFQLSKDLEHMYETSIGKDVTLQVGETSIKASKFILMARSVVFRQMFHHDDRNVVQIEDVDYEGMEMLVYFMYTGKLRVLTMEGAISLYYAANKYCVLDAQEGCSRFFVDILTVKNVCTILALADKHSDVKLKSYLIGYVCKNFKVIVNSEDFKELGKNNFDLVQDVLSNFAKYYVK